ncbi:MAG: ABC-F family ATP-binding cassette domain-containing protein [Oscillospiraceae bacterium]|nr:ABC-F family ATP-binding cassette domain-containing protein [Oscillospiraceae bacterium]
MVLFAENITKSFGADLILDHVSLKIENKDRIGLIGVNGCGKTTLLKILCGEESYDSGEISVMNTRIGYLKQNGGIDEKNTISRELHRPFEKYNKAWERMRSIEKEIANGGISESEYAKLSSEYEKLTDFFESGDGYMSEVKIKSVMNGMGFSGMDDTLAQTLSGGEKTRLALAKLLLEEPDLLILDEPTNHLDFKTLDWLEQYLSEYKGAILVVSHDRYFLDKITTSICEIEAKKLVRYNGNYAKYVVLKQERTERMQKEYDAQTERIAKLKEYAEKNIARASTSNSAKSRLAEIDRMELVEPPAQLVKPPVFNFDFEKDPVKDVLHVESLDLYADEEETVELLKGINIDVLRGEKVAIIGENGVGKSSLLKSIQKRGKHRFGKVTWGRNVEIGYYDQQMSGIDPNNTVLDELWNRNLRSTELEIRTALGRVRLTGENVYKKTAMLSGGEKAKLAFCILMKEKANTLILDEPSNHLDIAAKEALDKALQDFKGTLIMVSHDRYLLNRVPDRILEITGHGIDEYKGGYDEYLRKKISPQRTVTTPVKTMDSARFEAERKKIKTPTLSDVPNVEKKYRSKKERAAEVKKNSEIRRLEEEISFWETELRSLEDELTLPEVSSDYREIAKRCEKMDELRAKIDENYELWMELSGETEKEI